MMQGSSVRGSSIICGIIKILFVAISSYIDESSVVADQPQSSTLIAYRNALETLKNRDMSVSAYGIERREWIKSGEIVKAQHRDVQYFRSGSSRMIHATTAKDDPSGFPYLDQLGCLRSSSCFLLKRSTADAAFRLKYLGQNKGALKGLFDYYELNFGNFAGDLFSNPITAILQSSDFRVSGIDVGGRPDGLTRFRVSFKDLETPEVVYQGWFAVDHHLGWIIKGYEFQVDNGKGLKQTVKGTFDYGLTADGLAIPKRSQSIIEDASDSSAFKTTLEITDYQRTAPRASVFSLATYGLGAMESAPSSWTFPSAGSLITLCFVFLLLAIVFRRWSNFQSKKDNR